MAATAVYATDRPGTASQDIVYRMGTVDSR